LPELPEVETTRRGIEPHVLNRRVTRVTVRQPKLRWPVTPGLDSALRGESFTGVDRRGKYLLLRNTRGTLLIHLGMSGSLRILPVTTTAGKHDHVDIEFDNARLLRFTDPRRFGSFVWVAGDKLDHKLLASLGPEPLGSEFHGEYLYRRSRGRKVPVKALVMDSKVVVGVGNIYANEALFAAGISPVRAAGRISRQRYARLAEEIKAVLARAIAAGGTTLRDFTNSQGNPGYFKQSLNVYGRAGQACRRCDGVLREVRLGGRSTVYCLQCQK